MSGEELLCVVFSQHFRHAQVGTNEPLITQVPQARCGPGRFLVKSGVHGPVLSPFPAASCWSRVLWTLRPRSRACLWACPGPSKLLRQESRVQGASKGRLWRRTTSSTGQTGEGSLGPLLVRPRRSRSCHVCACLLPRKHGTGGS